MKSRIRLGILILCVCAIPIAVWGIYALFHGFFDSGTFEVMQSQWSRSKQLAVVGRRYDHAALGGLQYFVAIGTHPFSQADLEHAYYYDGLVFRAGSQCLTVEWITDHELAVRCSDHSIQSGEIAVQQKQVGNVTIIYQDIPIVSSK